MPKLVFSHPLSALVLAVSAAATGQRTYVPGPPPPAWRNDTANLEITAAFNAYLSHTRRVNHT